eukprot:gene7083-9667_t
MLNLQSGESAVMKATEYDKGDIVSNLILNGADVNLKNKDGKTALMIAKELKRNNIIELLPLEEDQIDDNGLTIYNGRTDNQSKEVSDAINSDEINAAIKLGYKKWNRSKICLVGEGRAGKTATANTIIGLQYEDTPSTIGINQITCDIKQASANNQSDPIWMMSNKAEKELEDAIASIILQERQKKINSNDNNNKSQLLNNNAHNSKSDNNDIGLKHDSKSVSINTVTSTSDSLPAVSAVKGFDNEKIMSLLSDKVSFSNDIKVSVYDYGGQDVFASIHHLFLTKHGIYAIVFNMEWLLDNAPFNTKNQCLSYIKFWFNSIAMHTHSTTDNSIAPIILIGTRKDKVIDVNDHVKISLLLFNTFKLHIAWRSVCENENGKSANGMTNLCFYPIDNIIGRNDMSIQSLLKTINNIISESDYIHKEIPLSWLQTVDKFSRYNKGQTLDFL